MNNNRCVICNEVIPEGRYVCPSCEDNQICKNCHEINATDNLSLEALKKAIWQIVAKEGIIITNQNIDWLLERAFKEISKLN